MKNFLIILASLLVLTVVGLGGYWVYSELSAKSNKIAEQEALIKEEKDKFTKTEAELKSEVESYKLLIAGYKSNEEDLLDQLDKATNNKPVVPAVNPYLGWKTYTSKTFGVTFKYPSHFTVSTLNQGYLAVEGVVEDQLGSESVVKKDIIKISETPSYYSYDNKKQSFKTGDPTSVTINKVKYPFTKYIMGEGNLSGYFTYTSFLAKLTSKLNVTLFAYSWGKLEVVCNSSQAIQDYGTQQACELDQQKFPPHKYVTTSQMQKDAIKVIESITFNK
jgi:hypothetical protein